jgi:hypothetical protein
MKDPATVARAVDTYFAQRFPGQQPLSYYELAKIVQEQCNCELSEAGEGVLKARPEVEWRLGEVQTP